MKLKKLAEKSLNGLRMALAGIALVQFSIGAPGASAQQPGPSGQTTTPIKHVIVIIGENRSFDHVFATYVPKNGQRVDNLLSKGIITLDDNLNAIPGRHFKKAQQLAAADLGAASGGDPFLLSPPKTEFPNNILPSPLVGGPSGAAYVPNACAAGTPESQCAASLTLAQESENGLPPEYYPSLLIGGAGLPGKDTRHAHHEREFPSRRSVSADQRQHLRLHRLRRKPGSPFLSNVAATELRPGACQLGQSLRLQR
jgi:phospholipase C